MTEFYLDTANLDEINLIQKWNVMSGITTNKRFFRKKRMSIFTNILKRF